MQTREKVFINLTNGIEALAKYPNASFLRIRSTTIERKDWIFLFMDLDHNFLIHLAAGQKCKLVDFGTNRKNSKTCYYAVPLIRYILSKRWFGSEVEAVRYGRNTDESFSDVKAHFEHVYNELFVYNITPEKQKLKKKIDYYKRFLSDGAISLDFESESTINDGNYPHYAELIKKHFRS